MAYDFDGANSKVTYTLAAGQKGFGARSYLVRIKRDTSGEVGYGAMFTIETAGGARRLLFANDNGDAGWGLNFRANFTGGDYNWSVPYPGDTNWHTYVIVYGGTSTAPLIWKDGVAETVTSRGTSSGTIQTDDAILIIGNRSTTAETWDGGIAEFAMWNRQLTTDEAVALGKGFSPNFFRNGLVFYTNLLRDSKDVIMGTAPTDTSIAVIPHPRVIYPSA